MSYNNLDLANAFPASVRDDALKAISILPQPSSNTWAFSVCVSGEAVSIPYRIFHDPALIDATRLTSVQAELLECLLTRHHSGFVREDHLANILRTNDEWVPPFVIQLVGEYVIEILQLVRQEESSSSTRSTALPCVPETKPLLLRAHETAGCQLLVLLPSLAAQGGLRRVPDSGIPRSSARRGQIDSRAILVTTGLRVVVRIRLTF